MASCYLQMITVDSSSGGLKSSPSWIQKEFGEEKNEKREDSGEIEGLSDMTFQGNWGKEEGQEE